MGAASSRKNVIQKHVLKVAAGVIMANNPALMCDGACRCADGEFE